MRCTVILFFVSIFFSCSVHAAEPVPVFTPEEKKWMAAHPVVNYGIDPTFYPVQYVEEGQHKGLTKEYIDAIARITGLKFRLCPVPITGAQSVKDLMHDGQIQLVPVAIERLQLESTKEFISYSQPYYVGTTLIVTRADTPIIFSPAKLKGKSVAIKGGGSYVNIQRVFPDIRFIDNEGIEQALDAVSSGKAYAALGSDIAIKSLLQRKYRHTLHIAGSMIDLPIVLAMGVSNDDPLLLSIVNKALNVLTAEDTDELDSHWMSTIDYGAPSVISIVRYYATELTTLIIAIALLALFARYARLAQRRAQRSEAEKSMFLAVMSHEIRTPMNAVLASIELLNRSNLNFQQKELADLANSSATNLVELLDDILQTSKLDAKRLELELRPTDLTRLVNGVVDSNRLRAQNKGLRLQLSLSHLDGAVLNLDPVRVRQILYNLLSNAVKFTEQGDITLEVQLRAVQTGNEGHVLTLSVQDSGIGISVEQQALLFQPFAQADKSTTRHYGGSGLGLMISKQLVELMGGEIALDSKLGVGTRITVSLPVAVLDPALLPEERHEATSTPAFASPSTSPILVVEDQPANQFVIERQLQELGYRATIVGDGQTALDLLRRGQQFSIVLLDCYMPGMDGYELARAIRSYEQESNIRAIPLIAISAATGEEHMIKCVDCGIDGTLSKPLSLRALKNLLGLWLPPQQPQALSENSTVVDYSEEFLASAQQKIVLESQQTFQTACAEDLSALNIALEKKDIAQAAYYAHRLHGVALMNDAIAFANLAKRLECELHDALEIFSQWHCQLEDMRRALSSSAARSSATNSHAIE